MSIRDDRRAEALGRIAAYLLQAGLPGSGLRSLAEAAGVSDRMLLYYFETKNEVLTLALQRLAVEMAVALDRSIPAAPKRRVADLRREIRDVVRGAALRPFMRLWLEIASRAARDETPYRELAGVIADGFSSWIAVRLRGGRAADAALLLATVEGIVLFDGIGRGAVADEAVAGGRK